MQYKGKLWLLHFIPFILFIKGDCPEHDKHCGRYATYGLDIQNLCRYCDIPTLELDQPYREPPAQRKNPEMIRALINANDKEGLKKISQHPIWNAWYELRFALHNNYGVHGACPVETLHWINLGMYKYTRENFFNQTGSSPSILSTALNNTAMHLGFLFQRQSDREKPRTMFTKGVMAGKLMGHEMSGMMLVLAATLRSSRGRNLILTTARGQQKQFFANHKFIRDWSMLIETQLQFETWLMMPEMQVESVKHAVTKVKEVMGLTKLVGKRDSGAGFNTMNFHATEHVPGDILSFGVPQVVKTFRNESAHKADKKSAKRTQKRPEKFDMQCGRRIQQRRAIDYAMHEIDTGMTKWDYFDRHSDNQPAPVEDLSDDDELELIEYIVGGAKAEYFRHPVRDTWCCRVHSGMKNKHRFVYDALMEAQLVQLGKDCERYFSSLYTYSEMSVTTREGKNVEKQNYRATPYFDGKPWQDWAMFDLSDHDGRDCVPCQMQCFVDLRDLPADNHLGYKPAIYIVIHPTIELTEGEDWSDIFKPHAKMTQEIGSPPEPVTKFQLVLVDWILEPVNMIPDLDNPNPRAYLRMVRRNVWAEDFETWLHEPHAREFEQQQTGFIAPIKKPRKRRRKQSSKTKESRAKSKSRTRGPSKKTGPST